MDPAGLRRGGKRCDRRHLHSGGEKLSAAGTKLVREWMNFSRWTTPTSPQRETETMAGMMGGE